MLNVTILNTAKVVFKGQAESVIFPGDTGVFEVMSYHKRMMSRLLTGNLVFDDQQFPIVRGVVKIGRNEVNVIVE